MVDLRSLYYGLNGTFILRLFYIFRSSNLCQDDSPIDFIQIHLPFKNRVILYNNI